MPLRLFVALAALLLSLAGASADPVADCNRLASNPNDPDRPGEGVPFDDIDAQPAITACLQAVDANPNDGRLVYQLGRAYDKAEDYDAAENAYLRAYDLGFKLASRNLGYLYDEGGGKADPEQAVRWLKSAVENGDGEALNQLAWHYAVAGENLAEAERLAKRAVELTPDDAEVRDTLGWIYFKQGKHEDAAAELERAIAITADDASFHAHLGWTYDALGKPSEARAAFERALALPAPDAVEDATFDKAAIEAKLKTLM